MNQEELLKSLMELDFIAVDLGLFAPSAAMPPIHRLGSGWKIHGLGRTMPIFLWQERSVNKCGFMKRNWNFL